MKILIISIIMYFTVIPNVYSQINIVINKLIVSNVNPILVKDFRTEGEEDGPGVFISILLSNDSKERIYLHPSETEIRLLFSYSGKEYVKNVINTPFFYFDKKTLHSKDTILIEFSEYLLLGTDLWSVGKGDYREILLELLPTLRIEYKDPNFKCHSTQIKSVKIYNTL